jgi:hypothetical protein
MAASRGVDNWNDNFKGQGDVSTVAKGDTGVLYEENGNRSTQQLTRGTPLTYIDSQSKSHLRVVTYDVNDKGALNPNACGFKLTAPNDFGFTKLSTFVKNISCPTLIATLVCDLD